MVQVTDLLKKKKFQKKSYRPWDIDGEGSIDSSIEKAKQENQTIINSLSNDIDNIKDNNKDNLIDNKIIKDSIPAKKNDVRVISSQILINSDQNNEHGLDIRQRIKLLFGHQKSIFYYIVRLCINSGRLSTGPFTNDQIVREINATAGTIKTSLRRLEQKNLVSSTSKRARGGFYRFEITLEAKKIGQEILNELTL